MRKSMNVMGLCRVVLAALFVPLTTTGHAQEGVLQLDVGRGINLEITIEPRVLPLSFVKQLYSDDEIVTIRSVIVPQLDTRNAPACRGLACLMQEKVVDAMDGKPTISEAEAEGYFEDFEPDTKSFIEFTKKFYPDSEYVIVKSIDNSSDAAARLKADGYSPRGTIRNVSYDGKTFNLTQWMKGVPTRDDKPFGTASAELSIIADTDIDFEKTIFVGNFKSSAPIVFKFDDLPKNPAKQKRAMELFGEFKNRVTGKYFEIIDKLNQKRRLLNPKEIAVLQGAAPGVTHQFKKKITLDWFGEKNPVKFVIAATPLAESGGLPGHPVLGEEEVWKPTEDDATW